MDLKLPSKSGTLTDNLFACCSGGTSDVCNNMQGRSTKTLYRTCRRPNQELTMFHGCTDIQTVWASCTFKPLVHQDMHIMLSVAPMRAVCNAIAATMNPDEPRKHGRDAIDMCAAFSQPSISVAFQDVMHALL